jgi:hypothetical protein
MLAMGIPHHEPAYKTPRYPQGIAASSLRGADADVQRETARFWFFLNLKPYDLSTGGPYFGFAEAAASQPSDVQIGGFGQGIWAPAPVDAVQALNEEFAGTLPEDLIQNLGDVLGSNWTDRAQSATGRRPTYHSRRAGGRPRCYRRCKGCGDPTW